MDLTEYKSTVIRKQQLTSTVVELVLRPDSIGAWTFKPGQYIQFLFDYTFRSYSMVNPPKAGIEELVFCIKLVPDGMASEYVKGLSVGDEVTFRGPYGDFTPFDNRDICCIATGVGIAPIRSIIEANINSNKNIRLLFGLREEEDIFYHDAFFLLARQHANFSFVPLLSRPRGSWQGEKGRVTDYLIAHPEFAQNHLNFICGSQAMVIDVRDILLRQGLEKENIKTEVFF